MSAATIHLVRVSSFCLGAGSSFHYIAVIGNKLSSALVVGKEVAGIGGITKGFVDKVSLLTTPQEFVKPLYQHKADRQLYLEIKSNGGKKFLSGIGEAGIIIAPNTIPTDADDAQYDCELHAL